jgi:hypothetical protein
LASRFVRFEWSDQYQNFSGAAVGEVAAIAAQMSQDMAKKFRSIEGTGAERLHSAQGRMKKLHFFTAKAQRRKGNAKENEDGQVIHFVPALPDSD